MIKYKFNSGVKEVEVLTDSPNLNVKGFTIVEVRGEGSAEVLDGLNFVEGVSGVREEDLKVISTASGYTLTKWDDGVNLGEI